MSLEKLVLEDLIKERLINEVSKRFKLPIEVCNMIYDFLKENPDGLEDTNENITLPTRPKFNNGDIYDPNIIKNEKPFYYTEK